MTSIVPLCSINSSICSLNRRVNRRGRWMSQLHGSKWSIWLEIWGLVWKLSGWKLPSFHKWNFQVHFWKNSIGIHRISIHHLPWVWCLEHGSFLSVKTLQVFKSLLPVTRLAGHQVRKLLSRIRGAWTCGNNWMVFRSIWRGKFLEKNWLYQLYISWLALSTRFRQTFIELGTARTCWPTRIPKESFLFKISSFHITTAWREYQLDLGLALAGWAFAREGAGAVVAVMTAFDVVSYSEVVSVWIVVD